MIIAIIVFTIYVFWKYYYQVKKEMKRYRKLLTELGFKIE